MTVSIIICGCSKQSDNIYKYNVDKIASIYDSTYGSSELYKDKEANYIYEVREDKIINKIPNSTPYDTHELLEINDNVDKSDITLKDNYSINTWEATIDESSAHIKFLQDKGYIITRQVNTSEFIDIHLSKSNDTKRVLIYEDKMLVSSIEPKGFNLENYIK